MSIRFTKMHGAGNDYIYFDCFNDPTPANPPALSREVSDRHKGIGGDGIVLITPPTLPQADARMRMFNADGSEAEMCGNAIRCVGKYIFDHHIARKKNLVIETGRGPLALELVVEGDSCQAARVNMASPILKSAEIPTLLPGDPPLNQPITVEGVEVRVTCVSMGNPHAVIYVDELTDRDILVLGPKIERHEAFPARVNVEFVQVMSPREIRMRVWERGSGETQACGTGACAVCVAGVLTGRTERSIVAHLPGGDLQLEWSESDNTVAMTGPATEVYQGMWISR